MTEFKKLWRGELCPPQARKKNEGGQPAAVGKNPMGEGQPATGGIKTKGDSARRRGHTMEVFFEVWLVERTDFEFLVQH